MSPTILLSRTDSIGDVVLTLPLAGLIKKHFPESQVIFLGRTYTGPIIQLSEHVDAFVNYDEWLTQPEENQLQQLQALQVDYFVHVFPNKELAKLAKAARIPNRIGTARRLFHALTVNHKLNFTRKGSDLHEAQLNAKLLSPLGIEKLPALDDIPALYGFTQIPELPNHFQALLDANKKKVILHPKSKGSAVEWGLENFNALLELLPADQFQVFITGTEAEGQLIAGQLNEKLPHVHNMTGQMSLHELIAFIAACDALVAASTGPLHIAAALQKQALGLFSTRRPIHPGRWAPLGEKAQAITFQGAMEEGQEDQYIAQIAPATIATLLGR